MVEVDRGRLLEYFRGYSFIRLSHGRQIFFYDFYFHYIIVNSVRSSGYGKYIISSPSLSSYTVLVDVSNNLCLTT